ncbi:MAG: DUF2085 domain-containing protein [Thermoplasmatota archaeon]
MKGGTPVKRSEMTREHLGERIIDDRPYVLRKACHGDPVRSFWFGGRPLPLCARCAAIYASIPVGILLGLVLAFIARPSLLIVTSIFALLVLPGALDGLTQYWWKKESNNLLRAYTGFLYGTGIGLGSIYIPMGFLGII